MKVLNCVLLLAVLQPSVRGMSESFTTSVRLAGRKETFKCSFQLVYTSTVHLKKSNLYCATKTRSTGEKLYILAPSGYRFSLVVDTNPTKIKKGRVFVPTLTYARARANDPLGARFSFLAGPTDWNGINPLFVWNGNGNWTRWTWDGQRTQQRSFPLQK